MRPAVFAAAWTAGQLLPLQQAVDEALHVTELADAQPLSIVGKRLDPGPLTARERQVAELVRRGLTNRLIGESLVITEGTAALHVKNALAKLGFTSRAQLAAWATERRELSIS
jgi:non-specific serine/threonine protein kinase